MQSYKILNYFFIGIRGNIVQGICNIILSFNIFIYMSGISVAGNDNISWSCIIKIIPQNLLKKIFLKVYSLMLTYISTEILCKTTLECQFVMIIMVFTQDFICKKWVVETFAGRHYRKINVFDQSDKCILRSVNNTQDLQSGMWCRDNTYVKLLDGPVTVLKHLNLHFLVALCMYRHRLSKHGHARVVNYIVFDKLA